MFQRHPFSGELRANEIAPGLRTPRGGRGDRNNFLLWIMLPHATHAQQVAAHTCVEQVGGQHPRSGHTHPKSVYISPQRRRRARSQELPNAEHICHRSSGLRVNRECHGMSTDTGNHSFLDTRRRTSGSS